jgi:magnesium transporter
LREGVFYKARDKAGLAPGTLQAPRDAIQPSITIYAYDADHLEETKIAQVGDIKPYLAKWPTVWVNVDGLADPKVIADLGELFGLHALALEDVLHIPQRAKVEDYDTHIFATMRMVRMENDLPYIEQVSMFWGKNFVLTFQEDVGDVFDTVRERLRKGGRRIRMTRADYMAYALIDAVIDGYFPVLEEYGEYLDSLEDLILDKPRQRAMTEIHRTKRELHTIRLCIWPMREALSRVLNGGKLVHKDTMPFMRDCHDHVIQILDIVENYRERASSLSDLYLSSISLKMNEVMKVLTVIATIFMPLTFIVGVYGMNFNTKYPMNMPELNSPYGYVAVMGFMLLVFVGMLVYFIRMGWIGARPEKDDEEDLQKLEENSERAA